jgi:hypothetical protein
MRPVRFLKYYEKGSTLMAADQIAAALRAQGVDGRAIVPAELGAVERAIIVCIKTSRLPHLLAARRRGNLLVLDVQDTVCFKRRLKNRWLFAGMIFKNRRQLADFGSARRTDAVLYHQWDPRYTPHRAGERQLAVGYLGLRRSLRQFGRLPGVECVDDDYFTQAQRFNCHLSLRESERDRLYKPGTKVSTAAACHAALITTRDESAREMLGEDYPYYTAADPASVADALARARATLGGALWRDALERLGEVRERTRIERIARDYVDYFARLETAAG